SSETAVVTLTYQSDSVFSNPTDTTVVATHSIPPLESINRYDGSSATDDQTDLETEFGGDSNSFFGSVVIESTIPVVAMVNQEATPGSGAQAGSYNGLIAGSGSQKISVPLIQSDFYGYYTSLTIMTVDGSEATVDITYTSDGTYSSVTNHSETHQHTTLNGFLNRYEGSSSSAAQSDLLDDAAWVSGTGDRRFIGSAVIEVVSGADIVAFVNSESSVSGSDSMYTYNAFNQKSQSVAEPRSSILLTALVFVARIPKNTKCRAERVFEMCCFLRSVNFAK
ncbi:MAG: hypothetical protein K8R89_03080, partial [Anaerolineae bacterium]|nr:hypothetical protein [Anaerolineae bacterium]